jgi:hypothetical protein
MKVRLTVVIASLVAALACGGGSAALTELERARSGDLDVVLLSPRDALRHGKDDFTIEFRAVSDGHLVDVGQVRATATMPMAGNPMFGSVDVQKTDAPGRYAAVGDFSMAGTWRLGVEWNGPAGQGSVNFSGIVQ